MVHNAYGYMRVKTSGLHCWCHKSMGREYRGPGTSAGQKRIPALTVPGCRFPGLKNLYDKWTCPENCGRAKAGFRKKETHKKMVCGWRPVKYASPNCKSKVH